jgi:hypothetical protein
VRFIAVSDGIDTFLGDNEIMPFKSVVNEYYARDISRKIRAAYRTKGQNGEYLGAYAPYGYRKDPSDKHRLIVDENTAVNVAQIFRMAADGLSPSKIASRLSKEGLLTPRAYAASLCGESKTCFQPKYPTGWSYTTIRAVLQNRAYLGHLVCNKHTTKSFKNKTPILTPKDQWIEVQNTHEPIVGEYLFDLAQKVARVKKRENTAGLDNIFRGLLRCSNCGGGLSYRKGCSKGNLGAYNCNTYRQRGEKYCSAHHISYNALYAVVLEDIKRHARNAKMYEDELSDYARELAAKNADDKVNHVRKELDKAKRRSAELDVIIKKLFEQNALGVISDERFVVLSTGYEREQRELAAKIRELQSQFDKREAEGDNAAKFLTAVRKYSEITELTAAILNDLIDSIVIHDRETTGETKSYTQKVDINYRFIGPAHMVKEKSQIVTL